MKILDSIKKLFHKRETLSFKQGLDLTNLPVITMYQGNVKLNFILDTGCVYSIIDARALKNLHYVKDDTQLSLWSISNDVEHTETCVIPINYKSKQYRESFGVKTETDFFDTFKRDTGVTVHGLLGSKFFEENKYVLDFKEYLAYEKN